MKSIKMCEAKKYLKNYLYKYLNFNDKSLMFIIINNK